MGKISIGGKEFFGSAEFMLNSDTVVSDQPGDDSSFITDMGVGSLTIRVRGNCTEETDSLSDVRKAIMTVGELELIFDSGWKYKVFRRSFRPIRVAGTKQTGLNGYHNEFEAVFVCEEPYQFTTSDNTRSKSITANNETWTADDSANALSTDGEVDAVPDIQVTGGVPAASSVLQATSDSNYNMSASGAGVTITQAATDGNGVLAVDVTRAQTVNCRKAGMAIIDSIQVNFTTINVAGNVTCTVYDSVGGTSLGSKVENVAAPGAKTFTFATPIAVVQDENTCADGTDSKKIYFIFTVAGTTNLTIQYQTGNPYADGAHYTTGTPTGVDLKFVATGHSCKEIRQTFEVAAATKLAKVILNMCKYQYAGSNPTTVVIKEGATTLGTGTVVLSGSDFADFDFILSDETANSLELSSGTTYTLVVTPPADAGNATDVLIKMNTTSVYASGSVTLVENGGTTRAQATHDLYFKLYGYLRCKSPQVYNTADSSVECSVANDILDGAIHRINVDGTGTIDFDDDFSTDRWTYTQAASSGVSHDTTDDELDIADDGYIYWKCDSKYPVTGIPTLTAQINITAGTPTIQISDDASTWYDIDTAIVDDVDTEYELDDSTNLSLKGLTLFYFRIDCVKAGAATCSVKSFELDVDIVTIDAENPVITEGGSASTYRCDQDAASGMNCTVALIYPDRRWPG